MSSLTTDYWLLATAFMDGFAHEHVRILTDVRGISLLDKGCPDKDMASDHLPVLLELKF